MRTRVGHHRDGRRFLQAEPFDVPADARQDGVTRSGEGREVGHRRARREADARSPRKSQQLDEPARSDLLGNGCCR